jgi:hypothetical protein
MENDIKAAEKKEEPGPIVQQKPENGENRATIIIAVIVVLLVLAALVTGIVFLSISENTITSKVRDIFIIFMALESLVIGAALIILIIQIAVLTNLIQSEVKPILDTTNETVNTLKGTATFLSDNLTEPVIKLNEYLAAIKQVTSFLRIFKK